MKCQKCGSENTVVKEGVSKKNGKPYKGLKCNDCNEMDFRAFNTGQNFRPQMPAPMAQRGESVAILASIDATLKAMLREIQMSKDPLEVAAKNAGAILGAKKLPEVPINGVDEEGPF